MKSYTQKMREELRKNIEALQKEVNVLQNKIIDETRLISKSLVRNDTTNHTTTNNNSGRAKLEGSD